MVDTERGSAALYADTFTFDTIDWTPPYDPREVAEDIRVLSAEYDVILIDSLTHFWQGEGGTLDIVEAAGARSSGNRFAGWKTGTPAQNAFVEAMLAADCHIIATMRSKMEYVLEADSKGRQAPRKVGMAPVQRDGIEYEFTVGAELDIEHRMVVTKSRCAQIADAMYPSHQAKDMAQTLAGWLNSASVDLGPYARQAVTTENGRKALGKEWRQRFPDFRSSAVPADQVESAKALINSFVDVPNSADVPQEETAATVDLSGLVSQLGQAQRGRLDDNWFYAFKPGAVPKDMEFEVRDLINFIGTGEES